MDTLTVINGPEDGAQFSLSRGPFALGAEGASAVCLRLDNTIRSCHARLVAANCGYRVRSSTAAAMSINGRRVGALRSRMLRSGDVLRVGYTELILECTEDGPASRSRGVVTESDFAWVLRRVGSLCVVIGGGCVRLAGLLLVGLIARWKLVITIAVAGSYILLPGFRATANGLVQDGLSHLLGIFRSVLS